MNRRLQQFLDAENINQSQFADTIGVARASVSHILAGRNKPGFDFIESMSKHYPRLNLEWLIVGKGKMYSNSAQESPVEDISENKVRPPMNISDSIFGDPDEEIPGYDQPSVPKTAPKDESLDNINHIIENKHHISKIVVFFDDNTFQELK